MLLKNIVVSAACIAATCFNFVAAQAASVSISNNGGGNILAFAMQTEGYRSSGTLVKFDGRCDSACTLFLGLPTHQTCISNGAYFRFHSPTSPNLQSERIAQAYLMRKYPRWVRAWIARKNGLTHNLITMDYEYASKFIHNCGDVASN